MKKTPYEIITEQILSQLEAGNVPWKKPWNVTKYKHRFPTNIVSKKGYRGINHFVLSFSEHTSPYWLTFNQCKKLDGKIKKGSRGVPVVFWKMIETKNEDGEEIKIPFMRYYIVFNTDQTEGLDEKLQKLITENADEIEFNPIDRCEEIVKGYKDKPEIKHEGERAFYNQSKDLVNLPKPEKFKSPEEYYATLFHELAHSTKHKNRLNRNKKGFECFGDADEYSKEELVAEMTAAFLCAEAGIETRIIENSAAYIKGWSSKLKENKKMVVEAAQKAQKAADYILGRKL